MVAVSYKASEAITKDSSTAQLGLSGFGERSRLNGFTFPLTRPTALESMTGTTIRPIESFVVKPEDGEYVRSAMRNLSDDDLTVEIVPDRLHHFQHHIQHDESMVLKPTFNEDIRHRVGVILSGGPAPGGHNVVCGVYDAMKEVNPSSEIIGFIKGIDGLLKSEYIELTEKYVQSFRNTGGFDMLLSGRGCVKPSDEAFALAMIKKLGLTGLIIIGGDGTNSNTAAIANITAGDPQNICSVIGVPKTIDGDLINESIKVSFGFDTASKVYSEQIGSIMEDVKASKDCWHFIRIMGRLASHLVLECALQTHPNHTIIAEEVLAKNSTLMEIVDEIVQMISLRRARGKDYGVILVPEGLITFIPEMSELIKELSALLLIQTITHDELEARLTPRSARVWRSIPSDIQRQMITEREASGYICVAKIATEKFISRLVSQRIRIKYNHHYFGYEGRCAIPSLFDAHYTYSLGLTAGQLVHHRRNGYLATLRRLNENVLNWQPVGVRFLDLLQKVHLPEGRTVAALMRQEVQLLHRPFKALQAAREGWKLNDTYQSPGPLQYHLHNAIKLQRNYYVNLPQSERDAKESRALFLSERIQSDPNIPQIFRDGADHVEVVEVVGSSSSGGGGGGCNTPTTTTTTHTIKEFVAKTTGGATTTTTRCARPRIGVCFTTGLSAGCNNLLEELTRSADVIGFQDGLRGLRANDFRELDHCELVKHHNLGGLYSMSSRPFNDELTTVTMHRMLENCLSHDLDSLILCGDRVEEITTISSYFDSQAEDEDCKVLGIIQGPHDKFDDLVGLSLGHSTNSAVQSNLIGNIASDAASMPKYYHFVRVDCAPENSAQIIESSWICRPNIYIIGEDQQNLASVIDKIANCIEERFEAFTKNHGVILLPSSLWNFIPELTALIQGGGGATTTTTGIILSEDEQQEVVGMGEGGSGGPARDHTTTTTASTTTATHLQSIFEKYEGCFRSFDDMNQRARIIPIEQIVAELVEIELSSRQSYEGCFQYVTHNLTYQGRGSMPSQLDCDLGSTLGAAAVAAVKQGLGDHLISIHEDSSSTRGEESSGRGGGGGSGGSGGMTGGVTASGVTTTPGGVDPGLKVRLIPFDLLRENEVVVSDDMEIGETSPKDSPPMRRLAYLALDLEKATANEWALIDRYANPGPIQFH